MKNFKLPTIAEAQIWGKQRLTKSTTAGLDARVLLEYVLKLSRVDLIRRDKKLMPKPSWERYQRLINQRVAGMPVAYITGTKEFMGFEVAVNRRVLIPRPATEAIVNAVIKLARRYRLKLIYEIGVGSGVISIAIARSIPSIKIVGSDISRPALTVARKNITQHKLTERIELIQSNLASHIKKATLVVANLPYLPEGLKVAEELSFEPKSALFVPGDGLDLYRKLFNQMKFDYAVIELGSRQYLEMAKWLSQKFPHAIITPVHDIDKSICGLQINRQPTLSE